MECSLLSHVERNQWSKINNAKVQARRRQYTRDVLMKDRNNEKILLSPDDVEDEVRSILAKTGLIPGADFDEDTLEDAMSSGQVLVYIWMSKR